MFTRKQFFNNPKIIMEKVHLLSKRIENHGNVINTLQKNNHLTSYSAFNKSLFKLTENATELEKLIQTLNQPVDPIFAKKDFQKQSLIFQYKHLIGILNLIYGKDHKKTKKLQLSDKKLETVEDRQLLIVAHNAAILIKKLSGLSMDAFEKKSSKAIAAKLEKAKKLSDEYGLTAEKVQKLESAVILFTKTMIESKLASKEQEKTIKRIKKLLDRNEDIFKNKTDKFVELYEKPDSSFMKLYNNVRFEEGEAIKEEKRGKKKNAVMIE